MQGCENFDQNPVLGFQLGSDVDERRRDRVTGLSGQDPFHQFQGVVGGILEISELIVVKLIFERVVVVVVADVVVADVVVEITRDNLTFLDLDLVIVSASSTEILDIDIL